LLSSVCEEAYAEGSLEKGISGIFRFFCLIGEKKNLTGTFGCKIRHLFFEMSKILVKPLEVEYNIIQSAIC
jgi:hypothetical protein